MEALIEMDWTKKKKKNENDKQWKKLQIKNEKWFEPYMSLLPS